MESLTLEDIRNGIILITTISAFFLAIYKWYKSSIQNKLTDFDLRIAKLEKESETNKKENTLLLRGQLACLKGLQEQGCNGPVSQSIKDIEDYLISK